MMRPIFSAAILLSIAVLAARSQPGPAPADSTLADSLVMRMMDGIGDAIPGRPTEIVADSQWHWTDIRTLPELMSSLPGFYAFESGEEGASAYPWYLGSSNDGTQLSLDGTPAGSPLFPDRAVTMFPLEFIQGIELLRGPAAILLGTRWNLRTHQLASPEPRTGIRFVQSPFETIFTDGFYTQNIARSTTLTFGFQRRTSEGRFENAALNSWSLRGRVRYNATPWLNLMGSWQYDKTSRGINGGIDRSRSTTVFDEVTALVVEPDSYELRGATTLAFHAFADVLSDSLSLTRLTVTRTDEEREFNRPVASIYSPAMREYAISGGSHVRLEQSLALPFLTLRGMAQLTSASTVDSTVLRAADRKATAYGVSIEGRFSSMIVPAIGLRMDNVPEGSRPAIGASLGLNITDGLSVIAAYEQRALFPGLRESAWRDSLVLVPASRPVGSERFMSLSASWRFSEDVIVSLEGFSRNQSDRLFYAADTTASGTPAVRVVYENVDVAGVQVSGRFGLGPFYVSAGMTVMEITASALVEKVHPPLWARWEVGWKERLFGDELGLQASLRGTFYDRYDGLSPDGRTGLFVLQSSTPVGRMTRLDGSVIMEIGNAFISLAWENILNTNYFKMATFPMSDRRFSLGVRWRFFD